MPFDLKKSFFELQLQKPVATGSSVDTEGALLQSTLSSDGEEVVQLADASGSLNVVGFSVSDNEDIDTDVVVEEATVPDTGSSTETVELSKTNLVGSGSNVEILVKKADGTVLTQVDTTPTSGEYDVDESAGELTFHSDEAGDDVTIQYRYNMTVLEARLKFFERNVNNQAGAIFNEVSVAMSGEIYTTEYDASVDWAGSVTPTTGADGQVVDGGGGTDISSSVTIIKTPTADDPHLGLRFGFRV